MNATQSPPHLKKVGAATQLFVGGKPVLLRAGEVENSSGTSREWMAPIWEKCALANMNCVLAAVPWDLMEPEEGQFDYDVIDTLIEDTRDNGMMLIPLWFGLWKNGLSHYAPYWIKADQKRFPRIATRWGNLEIVSTASEEAKQADIRAFAALMARIRDKDPEGTTVVMVQLENEVGISSDTRDRHPLSEADFNGEVPQELMRYLTENESALRSETLDYWSSRRTSGTWSEVFGSDEVAGHAFMSWRYASFLNPVAEAGKAEYDIPVFVNAALRPMKGTNRKHGPAAWGGPIAEVMDFWQAGAPAIDMLSPDIYRPDFEDMLDAFDRSGNPVFVPEARPEEEGAANAIYTFGIGGIGYSPFGIEVREKDHANGPISQVYGLIREIEDVVLEHQAAGTIHAVRLHPDNPETHFDFGGYRWDVERTSYWRTPHIPEHLWGYALMMQESEGQFLIAASGAQITFAKSEEADTIVGLGSVDEVDRVDGGWRRRRRLSGDEVMHSYDHAELNRVNQTGTAVKFWEAKPRCMRVRLYSYRK